MSQTIDVNGQSINYPETGDTNWGDEATDFAVQTSAAFGKLGLASGTYVDIAQTLDVTGNTTLDANLSVAGTTSLTGNVTLTNNLTVNGNTSLGDASGDSLTINSNGVSIPNGLNFDSNTLVIDATNNRIGINDSTPSEALDVTGNALISGTLGVTGNTTVDGVIYADDNTTANTPVISFTGDTNTGIGRSGADTLDFITNGNSRFRIEPTGQIKAVYESQVGDDFNTRLDNGYLCRAWVNFNGTATQRTGTYTISGTTVTVSITSHGLTTGNFAQLDFASGNGVDGRYQVTVINANSYTVTNPVSGSTGGNVTQDAMIRASGNVSSITDNGTGDYTVNFTTAMPDVNYSCVTSGTVGSASGTIYSASCYSYSTSSASIQTLTTNGVVLARTDLNFISVGVFR